MTGERRAQGDFSRGSVSRLILRLGMPVMLAELVHVLYNVVDRMYIGHLREEGTLALTALGVCFPLITLIGAFANLCSTGGSTLMTIARGEGNDEKAGRIMDNAFTLLLVIGLVLTLGLYGTAPGLLRLLGGDDQTMPAALGYFRIYVLGTVPVLLSLGMNPFITAQGFPRVGMITVVLGAVLNILLDPLLIFTAGMGVRGAALATVVSQIASAAWAVCFLRSRRAEIRLRMLCLEGEHLGPMLKLGMTGFTFRVTNSITQAVVNITLRAWGGPLGMLYVGAVSLINSLREIMSLPLNGITTAGQNVMSYNHGARKKDRVSGCIRFILLSGLGINVVMWLLVLLIPHVLFGIFSSDQELLDLTARCARIYFGAFPFMALQQSGQSTFVALNYPRYALFFSLLRKILLVLPLTLLLPPLGLGADGVFWAEFLSQLFGATACFLTMARLIWRPLKQGR